MADQTQDYLKNTEKSPDMVWISDVTIFSFMKNTWKSKKNNWLSFLYLIIPERFSLWS